MGTPGVKLQGAGVCGQGRARCEVAGGRGAMLQGHRHVRSTHKDGKDQTSSREVWLLVWGTCILFPGSTLVMSSKVQFRGCGGAG